MTGALADSRDRGARRVASSQDLPLDVVRFAGLPAEERRLLLHAHELIAEIAHGTVVLVLQDGKVIQIETSEKVRIRQPGIEGYAEA